MIFVFVLKLQFLAWRQKPQVRHSDETQQQRDGWALQKVTLSVVESLQSLLRVFQVSCLLVFVELG